MGGSRTEDLDRNFGVPTMTTDPSSCRRGDPLDSEESAASFDGPNSSMSIDSNDRLPSSWEQREDDDNTTKQSFAGKQVIHLLSGSYVLDLNYNQKLMRKALKKQGKERRKLQTKYTNTPTSFDLNPTVGNWKECLTGFNGATDDSNVFATGQFNQEGMSAVVALGTIFSIVAYVGDLISDLATAYLLYTNGQISWFFISISVTVLPVVAVNVVSLVWYHEDKLYHGKGWIFRVASHFCCSGVICRHVDVLINGYHANRAKKRATHVFGSHYSVLFVEQRRIAATLNLIESFLQDAPQFSLQVYIWTVENRASSRLLLENFHVVQYLSIAFSLCTLCYSVVSFHQALRFAKPRVIPMNFLGCVAQFIWRAGTTGSRILAIVFALSSFPVVTMGIVLLHWAFMVIWLQQQSPSSVFLVTPLLNRLNEKLCGILMAGVHVYCYLNLLENHTGYRLVFYYGLQLVEDSLFIMIWYSEYFFGLSNYEPWIYHAGSVIYFNAFFLGVFAMMIFFMKLHPNMTMKSPDELCTSQDGHTAADFVTKFKSNFHLLSTLRRAKSDCKAVTDDSKCTMDDFEFHDTSSLTLLEETGARPT